ncbi:MAG: AAA family ATPase [Mycobacterium sp.]|nr:AAA family ATPase [Mycobacterium sp.]
MANAQQRSPYTPGSIAHRLPGRDVHLGRINVHLTNLSVYRQLDGRVHVFVGPRGVGKTSLLRAAQRDAQNRTFTTVWATGGDSVSLSVDLANEFDKLVTAKWTDAAKAALTETLKTVRLNFGVASLQLAAGKDKDKDKDKDSPEFVGAARALQQAITAAANGAVEAGSAGLVIFVDELQAADPVGIRALAYAWQHMQAEAPELPAAVFAAGLSHTQDTVASAVSFGERFEYRHLYNLSHDEAALALTAPAQESGVGWQPSALDSVLRETEGYPYFIQEFGDKMWEAAGYPGPGGVLTMEHYGAALAEFEVARNTLFRSRWAQATAAEQKLIAAMASLSDGDVKRKEVAAAMGVPSTAISMARQSLMDKGLIEATSHGRMRFTAPGLAQYIRDYVAAEDDE